MFIQGCSDPCANKVEDKSIMLQPRVGHWGQSEIIQRLYIFRCHMSCKGVAKS